MTMYAPSRRPAQKRDTRPMARGRNNTQNADTNERWFYQQAGVKILQISQDNNNLVNVTLLRHTDSRDVFSSVTVWKLPFKLKHLKTFLMHPFLSDIEKEALSERLAGLSTDQFKFEKLMFYRLTEICKALPYTTRIENYSRGISTDNDWSYRLCSDRSVNNFIAEVMEKNNIKLSYK